MNLHYTEAQITGLVSLREEWKAFIKSHPTQDPLSFWSTKLSADRTAYDAWLSVGSPTKTGDYTLTATVPVTLPTQTPNPADVTGKVIYNLNQIQDLINLRANYANWVTILHPGEDPAAFWGTRLLSEKQAFDTWIGVGAPLTAGTYTPAVTTPIATTQPAPATASGTVAYDQPKINYLVGLKDEWKNWIITHPSSDPQSFWSAKPTADRQAYIEWVNAGQPITTGSYTPKSTGVDAVPEVQSASRNLSVPSEFTASKYTHPNTSFSGTDILATITPLGGKPMVFAEIQTISYSIYRPIMPVSALGRINPKGVVRGPRTIAGSVIFTVFDRHALKEVMNHYSDSPAGLGQSYGFNANDIQDLRKYAKTDEMPPFDINITFLNEYGNSSTMTLYGVYILTEGQTMSIEDMITENTMQFIAMDIDLMDYGTSMTSWTPQNAY